MLAFRADNTVTIATSRQLTLLDANQETRLSSLEHWLRD
jgi:hypothetical protein